MAQSLYVRLIMLVDDFGRYEADPELLRSETFPFGDPKGGCIQLTAIVGGLQTLASSDMLFIYAIEGKHYLQLTRWQERARSESKFPNPEDGQMLTFDNICQQMIASPPSPSPSPSPSPKPSPYVVLEKPNWEPTPEHLRLGAIFKRRPSTKFNAKELKAWKAITPIDEDDLAAVERYYKAAHPPDADYRIRSLETLLNKWNTAVDRARQFKPKNRDCI